MLILQGTLRQAGEINLSKDDTPRPYVKLWVEHETPREKGVGDLAISELLIPKADCSEIPPRGSTVNVAVRAYVAGRNVAYSALSLVGFKAPSKA